MSRSHPDVKQRGIRGKEPTTPLRQNNVRFSEYPKTKPTFFEYPAAGRFPVECLVEAVSEILTQPSDEVERAVRL